MKKVILMLVVVLSVTTASAQLKLGLNGGLMIPTAEGAKLSYGGGISGEYLVSEKIGIDLGLGYYVNSELSDLSLIPVSLGAKYYFIPEGSINPYAGVGLGYYTAKFGSYSTSDFGIAPVVGLQFGLSDALSLDVNAKYHLIFTEGESTSNIGFNVGIVYKF